MTVSAADSASPDNLSRDGAERIAARLAEYWRERGAEVRPVVRAASGRLSTGDGHSRTIYCVDLPGFVNGMPPRSARI